MGGKKNGGGDNDRKRGGKKSGGGSRGKKRQIDTWAYPLSRMKEGNGSHERRPSQPLLLRRVH